MKKKNDTGGYPGVSSSYDGTVQRFHRGSYRIGPNAQDLKSLSNMIA